MNRIEFLDRVVAPGNFLAVAAKTDKGLFNRFFARSNVPGASRFLDWCDRKGWDTWYAVASYTTAELHTGDTFKGRRTQDNAHNLKAFWFDADIKRNGDGKDPSKVFTSEADVIQWAAQFCRSTGIPRPNLWVCSGYGMHLYWTLEDALDRTRWQPYAEALKAALIAGGARGDASIVADAARILRPIETNNYKVPSSPAPCFEHTPDRLTKPDYPNAQLLAAIPVLSQPTTTTGTTAGQRMTAAAKAGLEARPHSFALIANQCLQVQRSAAESGANDGRQLWHSLVTLAWFCEDGRGWAHMVGNGHSKYTPAETDKEFDQVGVERAKKNFGPSLCKTFDAERPGVCGACPYQGTINTPFSLGVSTEWTTGILPNGYQNGWYQPPDPKAPRIPQIQHLEDGTWEPVISGGLSYPRLFSVDRHYRLCLDYTTAQGQVTPVDIEDIQIDRRTNKETFIRKGITLASDKHAQRLGNLHLAWIKQLVDHTDHKYILTAPKPFGWSRHKDETIRGLAIASVHYGTDGSEEWVGGGDPTLARYYDPRGSFEQWQKAAELIVDGVPEHMVSVCIGFGAPLMIFTGESCSCLSFVGPSGCGKTSALRAQAAMWGAPRHTMMQISDTANFFSKHIGEISSYPVPWDDPKFTDRFTPYMLSDELYRLTSGRGKGRLDARLAMRETGEWNTIVAFSNNNSLNAALAGLPGDTSATLLRLLEISTSHLPAIRPDLDSQKLISSLDNNYGHAGRMFIKYVVGRINNIEKVVRYYSDRLYQIALNEERFYVAGGAAILAGAAIAKKINLIRNLDLAAMENVIIKAIKRARNQRSNSAPTDPVAKAIKALSDFCNHWGIKHRLVTKSFASNGAAVQAARASTDRLIKQPPSDSGALAYHIGIVEAEMRIDRAEWERFCTARGWSFDMLNIPGWQSKRREKRLALGAATPYASQGRIRVICLDLTHPNLASHLDDWRHLAGSDGPNVVPLRGL